MELKQLRVRTLELHPFCPITGDGGWWGGGGPPFNPPHPTQLVLLLSSALCALL